MTRHPRVPVISPQPLSQPSILRDLGVTAAGYMPRKTQWIHHRFKLHAVGLVISGSGTYQVGSGSVRPIEPGSVFAVYPGPVFHYGAHAGTSWEEYYVCIVGPGIKRLIESGLLFVDGTVHAVGNLAALVERHREMQRVLKRGLPGDADRAVLLAEQLLLEMYYSRASLPHARPAGPSLEAVLAYCREHCGEAIDFRALARRNAMSYSLLRQRLKQITGAPPAQYLTRLRCEAARTLLTDTDLSVKEIGVRVGVDDPYSFSRTFKKCVGLSPVHYRRQTAPWHDLR